MHKSNFRLLDLFILKKYNRKESIPSLVNHILEESDKYWGINDIYGYIQKLVQIVIRNRLDLIGKFETLNGEKWQDIVRNISIFGEELDLRNLRPMRDDWYYKNPHSIISHYDSELKNIFIGINRMIESIEENYKKYNWNEWEKDFDKFIDWFFRSCSSYFTNYIHTSGFTEILKEKLKR